MTLHRHLMFVTLMCLCVCKAAVSGQEQSLTNFLGEWFLDFDKSQVSSTNAADERLQRLALSVMGRTITEDYLTNMVVLTTSSGDTNEILKATGTVEGQSNRVTYILRRDGTLLLEGFPTQQWGCQCQSVVLTRRKQAAQNLGLFLTKDMLNLLTRSSVQTNR